MKRSEEQIRKLIEDALTVTDEDRRYKAHKTPASKAQLNAFNALGLTARIDAVRRTELSYVSGKRILAGLGLEAGGRKIVRCLYDSEENDLTGYVSPNSYEEMTDAKLAAYLEIV
jgi:hypothetical protein